MRSADLGLRNRRIAKEIYRALLMGCYRQDTLLVSYNELDTGCIYGEDGHPLS
jgi:hypothetical protein